MPDISVARQAYDTHAPIRSTEQWYRMGDGFLTLDSDDEEFNARLWYLYRECYHTAVPPDTTATGQCHIATTPEYVTVTLSDVGAFDPYQFALRAAELRCEPTSTPWSGWRAVTSPGGDGVIGFSSTSIRATPGSPWRSLVGAMLLVWILSRQAEVFCFHAAALSVHGRGLLLIGRKAAGKTTLSLALGARGHGLLSDEVGTLHAGRGTLLPFRRVLNIRSGPTAPTIAQSLESHNWPVVIRDDGTPRVVVHASDIVPQATAAEVPLSSLVILSDRQAHPVLTPIKPSRERLADLTPHESSFWRPDRGLTVMKLLSSLTQVPWFTLRPGTVPATADLLERIATDL